MRTIEECPNIKHALHYIPREKSDEFVFNSIRSSGSQTSMVTHIHITSSTLKTLLTYFSNNRSIIRQLSLLRAYLTFPTHVSFINARERGKEKKNHHLSSPASRERPHLGDNALIQRSGASGKPIFSRPLLMCIICIRRIGFRLGAAAPTRERAYTELSNIIRAMTL